LEFIFFRNKSNFVAHEHEIIIDACDY